MRKFAPYLLLSLLAAPAATAQSPLGTPAPAAQSPLGTPAAGPQAPLVPRTVPHGTPSRAAQVTATPPTLGALSESIASPPLPAAWARLTIPIARCATPPKIDGSLDDPCWRTATHHAGFYPLGSATPIAPADQTETWVCADKTHLYVAFHCLDSHPNRIHASETVRDSNGVFQDDFVAIDVDSQNSRHNYSSFYVNARGTQNETLEGGTADNITWAGDWKAAARRVPDGWTAEMAIPFALLRYPRGATAFGLDFYRFFPRNQTYQNWPYLPPQGDGADEGEFIHEFTDLAPPFYAPRPIFLPYILATGGAGNSVREGMDIKYPLTTTLTGVATLFPDFQTIEQDVTSINFSYNEKLLTDRRPFFAEGSSFFPDRDLFYSRRIPTFDGGLKVAGKQDNTTIGFLGTVLRGPDAQSAAVLNVQQDLGLFSHVLLDAVDDVQKGLPSNQTAKLEGVYGWESGPTRFALQADHLGSATGQRAQGGKDYYQFSNAPLRGHLAYQLSYEDIGPNFVSNLGYNPEINRRGETAQVSQSNRFDRGWLQSYYSSLGLDTYQFHSGGFFHNDLSSTVGINTRNGLNYEIDYGTDRRNQLDTDTGTLNRFHDHATTLNFNWGGRTLYQQGGISEAVGRQAGQRYNFLTLAQGVFVKRPFNVQLNYSRLLLGRATSTQAIITGTYRLNAVRTVGARIVNQSGKDQGTGLGTDIYFSFGQHVRSGDDIYLLFGDPNSPKTRGKVTLKVIRPF